MRVGSFTFCYLFLSNFMSLQSHAILSFNTQNHGGWLILKDLLIKREAKGEAFNPHDFDPGVLCLVSVFLSYFFLSLLLFSVELYYDTLREYFGRVISNMIVVLRAFMSLGQFSVAQSCTKLGL